MVAGYSGDAGDAMSMPMYSGHIANGMKFSTPDSDNDLCPCSCAVERSHGWWFNYCTTNSVNYMNNAIWTAGVPTNDIQASRMLVKT